MRVLGIDPGTRHLGWGVIDQVGTRVVHVAHGVIDTNIKRELAFRLVEIHDQLQEIVASQEPDVGVVEALFFSKDPQAAAKLGHARGVVLLCLSQRGIPIFEYPPARVKRAVVGSGMATKDQVSKIMSMLLKLSDPIRVDAADALANAFAHTTLAPFASQMQTQHPTLPKPYRPARRR